MFTEECVNTSMAQEFSQTMSGLVKMLIGKNEVTATPKELLKYSYDLMKQLARKIVYKQTNQSMIGENKTELTQKTEFSMHESIYTLIRRNKPKKKKKGGVKSQILKQNTTSLHYSNICQMIKNNNTKLIRNKLTLQQKSKKIVKKRTYNREKSLIKNIESMEKLLSCWKKDFKKKAIVENLKWSTKSIYKSYVLQNEIVEQNIQPVAIVPPLPLPIWAKALEEPPQTVILRKTPSLNPFFDPHSLRSKVIMKRKGRKESRRFKPCMIPTETLTRALTGPRWTKGPRQVPVSTFQATRIHYRFLLAKYGKSRLMGRKRVYPNSIKSNVHSNFSVINLLHDVEEAISQNKYSRETDKIVKNFKDELNKDLLYNEPINKKYKYQTDNLNNSWLRKKGKLIKDISRISLTDLVEKLARNDSDESCNDTESDHKVKMETFNKTGQSQYLDTNNPVMNSLGQSESNSELLNSFDNEFKNNTEDIEVSKISQNKKFVFKEKRTIKKKKTLMKEPKPENISEEERLNTILQELHKQIKLSEIPTPIFLTKNDSLTELNFAKEPLTYLSMHASSMATDTDSQVSNLEYTAQKEPSFVELPKKDSKQSLLIPSDCTPMLIKNNRQPKSEQSSTKLYTFRIDYDSMKKKPTSICNIITALDRVNKLLQNIPIEYDKNTGRPYLVYDPKSIVKVIKEVNIKQEYKMVVKKCNKKTKNDSDTDKSLDEINDLKTSIIETIVNHEEKGLEEVESQLLKNKEECDISSQTFESENFICYSNNDVSLEGPADKELIGQQREAKEPLKSQSKNIESINHTKTYFEQVIKTATAYQISGTHHQAIIYLERQEYFSMVQSTACENETNVEGMNQNVNKEKNLTKLSRSSYTELKAKYLEKLREHKNVSNELSKKYCRHLTYEDSNQIHTNISQKYYQQYNKTRKLLLSKYEVKRNFKKETEEKESINNPCLKINLPQSQTNNEENEKTNLVYKQNLSNIINKPENTSQDLYVPKTPNTGKPFIFDEKWSETKKDLEMIHAQTKYIQNKNDHINGHNRPLFNPITAFDCMQQINSKKNDIFINTTNKSEGLSSFSINKSTINDMLRSVSINTIPNTYPMRNEITKQVFYCQVIYPHVTELNGIYKNELSPKCFKSSQQDEFSKFIYYKENIKLKTYKNDINQQIIDLVIKIKNDINNNINSICRTMNIDNQLLIQFLKICFKQNELYFEENKKMLILEKEIEELKSIMEEHLGKTNNPQIINHRKPKGPTVSEDYKIELVNNSKVKYSILKTGLHNEEISTNQILKNNEMIIETNHLFINDLIDIYKKKPFKEFFKSFPQYVFSNLVYYKENSKIQKYRKYINREIMSSIKISIGVINNINNICHIVNIDNKLLIKFLAICLKQNEQCFKEEERSSILKKEMDELKSLMKEHLGKKTNPLRLIQLEQKGPSLSKNNKITILKINSKIKLSNLKKELNREEINTNQVINNNRLCIEILRLLNLLMLIFSLISYFI